MAGRKKMSVNDALRNDSRRKIISAIEKAGEQQLSITDLEKALGINRGTLKHHLKVLEREGVIGRRKPGNELGNPAKFFSNRSKLSLNTATQASHERKDELSRNREKILKILAYVSKNRLSKSRMASTSLDAANLAEILEKEGFLDSFYVLTEKGKRFLNSVK